MEKNLGRDSTKYRTKASKDVGELQDNWSKSVQRRNARAMSNPALVVWLVAGRWLKWISIRIRDFLREDAYNREHLKVSYETKKSECTYQQVLNNVIVNTSLISNLIFPVVLLIGLFLVFVGDITVGTMSTAASMANFVITPCHQITQAYAKVKATKGIKWKKEK